MTPPTTYPAGGTRWGIRRTSTGQWCENAEFGTREEAEAYRKAQWHREWIEGHEVAEKPATDGRGMEAKAC